MSVKRLGADGLSYLLTKLSAKFVPATRKINNIPLTSDITLELPGSGSASQYAVCNTASATSEKAITLSDFTLTVGATIAVKFTNAVTGSASLNVSSLGAKNIYCNNVSLELGMIPENFVAFMMYDGVNWVLLNPYGDPVISAGNTLITESRDFTVPAKVHRIKVSACAAGLLNYAGEYIYEQPYIVTPGQVIPITVGDGNTVIGSLVTLIAGTATSNLVNSKLGYTTGYAGDGGGALTHVMAGGYGGLFGYGGGGGGYYGGAGSYPNGGNGGAIDGLNSTYGGIGGKTSINNMDTCDGGDARMGNIIYSKRVRYDSRYSGTGGGGSLYAAGGGGGGKGGSSGNAVGGSGGCSGGYGAGGGVALNGEAYYGLPSPGAVFIEWDSSSEEG